MAWTLRGGLLFALSERAWHHWDELPQLHVASPVATGLDVIEESTFRFADFLHHDFTSYGGLAPSLLMLLVFIFDILALVACARHCLRDGSHRSRCRREDRKDAEDCTVHAECQTVDCDFLCNRCELKSREMDQLLGSLLNQQKKAATCQSEVAESRSQLAAARERLKELGDELREQKLQNSVQAKRLERALKEWNQSDIERRRSECQQRVLEQELERLRSSTEVLRPALTTPPMTKRVSWPRNDLEEKVPENGRGTPRNEARRRMEGNLPEAASIATSKPFALTEEDSQAKVSTSSDRSPSTSTTSLSPRESTPPDQ